MMKTLIYGNGAMARTVYSYARNSNGVVGFTVDENCIPEGETLFQGLPLVPFSRVETVFDPRQHSMIVAVGFVQMNRLRQRKWEESAHKGFGLTGYVHHSVIRHDDVSIGDGCIILDHVSIHAGSNIGRGSFISSNVNVGHDCRIDEWNWINSGVAIGGKCTIGQGCFFGVNSAATDGITLGQRNFVAANTLINRNTEDNQVYLSEPGQLFRLESDAFLRFARITG
jgi:sugar O-acyltransferase (sialic acid O-acetyltransferase NeuD family)